MVSQGRLEKVRAAWEAKREGGCLQKVANNLRDEEPPVSARVIVAKMMRVNARYVGEALRIRREAPELFGRLHAGEISMQAALEELNGKIDAPHRQEVKTARSEFNRAANDSRYPDFLERFHAFMAQFPKQTPDA